jgi:hypothetical protein
MVQQVTPRSFLVILRACAMAVALGTCGLEAQCPLRGEDVAVPTDPMLLELEAFSPKCFRHVVRHHRHHRLRQLPLARPIDVVRAALRLHKIQPPLQHRLVSTSSRRSSLRLLIRGLCLASQVSSLCAPIPWSLIAPSLPGGRQGELARIRSRPL